MRCCARALHAVLVLYVVEKERQRCVPGIYDCDRGRFISSAVHQHYLCLILYMIMLQEKVKYENVKDQFEVVPRRGSLLKDGFLPVATYKQLVEEKAAAEEELEEHADDRGGPHGVVPIYEKAEDV